MDINGRGISYRTGIVARPDARNKMQLKSCIGYKFSLIRATREGIYAQWMSPLMENAASVFNRLTPLWFICLNGNSSVMVVDRLSIYRVASSEQTRIVSQSSGRNCVSSSFRHHVSCFRPRARLGIDVDHKRCRSGNLDIAPAPSVLINKEFDYRAPE